MKLTFTLNGESDLRRGWAKTVQQDLDAEEKRVARGVTRAAQDVAKRYQAEARQDIKNSGLSNAGALANTWKARVYPASGSSLSPAVWINSRAPLIVDAFSNGATIVANGRKFLAIPVGAAVPLMQQLNAATNRSRNGAGRFANEAGKVDRVAAALGVKLVFKPSRRGGGVLEDPRTRTVYFVLTKSVTLGKRMMGRDMLAGWAERWPADFQAALQRYL